MPILDESYILANMPKDLSEESLDIYAEQLCSIEPAWTEDPPGTWSKGDLPTRLAAMAVNYNHDDCMHGVLTTLMHKVFFHYANDYVARMNARRKDAPLPV